MSSRVPDLVKRALTVALVLGIALALLPQAAVAATPQTKTPIKHFVSLMQQNHSFDNYFGTYPGVDGIPDNACMPINPARPKAKCIKPFHLGVRAAPDLSQNEEVFSAQYRNGRMTGFIDGLRQATGRITPTVMGYYDDSEIPFYWNVADQYVLFDRFFAASHGSSLRNAMYWMTGTPGNYTGQSIPPDGFGDLLTIFDRLQARRISWKVYIQNYDPGINFRSPRRSERSSQVNWMPLLAYDRFLDSGDLRRHLVDLNEYFDDLRAGNLPAVSYIVAPSGGSSEHAPGTEVAGQRFVKKLMNALIRSESWKSSAFMWTYDGWGGWYDHVKPPQVDSYGYGFRVPAVLVSPYARRGYVQHETMDSTSILKFIEQNWGLPPLASRDRKARTFLDAFDFASAPREAAFTATERSVAKKPGANTVVIYVVYMLAVAFTGLVIAWAAFGWTPFNPRVPAGRGRTRR
jgi:phospholipase C